MASRTSTSRWTPRTFRSSWRTTGTSSGLLLDPGDANDLETVSAIIRITGGNFRLIERLMDQVARVMEIKQLDTLDPDVIHAARQTRRRHPLTVPNSVVRRCQTIRQFTTHGSNEWRLTPLRGGMRAGGGRTSKLRNGVGRG